VQTGVIAGYPIVDVKVTIFDGSYMTSIRRNGVQDRRSMGFKEGFRKASRCLLEPIMKVEVVTPEDYYGDIVGGPEPPPGQIVGMEDSPSGKVVTAMCRSLRCSSTRRRCVR